MIEVLTANTPNGKKITIMLEEINFETPVLLQEVLTTPSRDANGEMNEKKPTVVEKYSMAQQFFFRRGPKISEKAVVFLKAYLSYTDLWNFLLIFLCSWKL